MEEKEKNLKIQIDNEAECLSLVRYKIDDFDFDLKLKT